MSWYRPLTPHQHRIRLITLLPEGDQQSIEDISRSSDGDAIDQTKQSESNIRVSCTLSHESLQKAPSYVALSYNWGDSSSKRMILVNEAAVSVNSSLEAVLRHLRPKHESLTLWVDALCINQDNDEEKSEQLERMRNIYKQATSVIAWLGPAADDSNLAMEWIQEYGGRSLQLGIGLPELRLRHLLEQHDAGRKEFGDGKLLNFITDMKKDFSPGDARSKRLIAALTKIVQRPYWSRIWVVQELSCAFQDVFMCGNHKVSGNAMNHAMRLLRNFGQYESFQNHHNTVSHYQWISSLSMNTTNAINLFKIRNAKEQNALIHLMRQFRRFQSSEPRDKVFALLGISSDAESLDLHPDYSKSVNTVYIDVARKLILDGYVEIISFCEHPKRITGLPSWVPDWSMEESVRDPLQQRSLDRSTRPLRTVLEPMFSASGNLKNLHLKSENVTCKNSTILLRATFIGEVSQVGSAWDPDSKPGTINKWLADLQRFSCHLAAPAEIERAHAVWRTAAADQEIRQGVRKPRLSEVKINTVHESLKDEDLSSNKNTPTIDATGLSEYYLQVMWVGQGRRPLLVSHPQRNYIAIGPKETEVGDLSYVIIGAETPYVLHRSAMDGTFKLVGEAFIHGIMDGEVMEGTPAIETILLS